MAPASGTGPPRPGRRRRRGGGARHRPVQPRRLEPTLLGQPPRLPMASQRHQAGRPRPPGGRSGRVRAGPGHGGLGHARLPGLCPGLSAPGRGSGRHRGDPGAGAHRPADVWGGPGGLPACRDRVRRTHPGGGMVGTCTPGSAPLARHVAPVAAACGPRGGTPVGRPSARGALVPPEGPDPSACHPAGARPHGAGRGRAAWATTVEVAASTGLTGRRGPAAACGGGHAGSACTSAGGGKGPPGTQPCRLRLRPAAHQVRDLADRGRPGAH